MEIEKTIFVFFALFFITSASLSSVYAEVNSLKADKVSYQKGETINFSGTVDENSSGLVTIVIRDSNGDFVLLSQSLIQPDNTYENSIKIGEKFTTQGRHNVTGFIFNHTAGASTSFNFSFEQPLNIQSEEKKSTTKKDIQTSQVSYPQNTSSFIEPPPEEPIISLKVESESKTPNPIIPAPFVDKSKDPQYYLDRYYTEPSYMAWFDKNYPDLTIEEAVGFEVDMIQNPQESELEDVKELINGDLIPEAEASSISEPIIKSENNSEMATMSLAIGGIGILFAAVYGIKRKVDSNSFQISQNRATIKKKLSGILNNDPINVIRDRLAKGEISVEEFNKLKNTLKKN